MSVKRVKRVEVVEAVTPSVPELPVVVIPHESIFEDDEFPELPDDIPALPVLPDDGIPRLDSDLTPDEKQIFIRLLNEYMPLRERAIQLAKLANFTDQKRAAVGLRALQEINAICNITGDRPTEAAPMFVLPPDAKVQINVTKVEK